MSPDTNKRFDHGDLCAPAADPQQTLRDVATRLLELKIRHGSRQPPTPESLRRSQGWIQEEQPIYYKTYFQVTADVKKAMESTIDEAFAAAGVAPPRDLSTIWAHKQAYLDALKTAVDATAGEWKLAQNACRGYACALAKKSIQKGYKGASIKGVYGRDWRISKNNLDIPTHKYMDLWIVFQVRGEPYCQVRSATATEQYAGGGKYQKARGVRWGYARFQTSCR